RRDLTGIWDAGNAGINGTGYPTPPLTPWGEEVGKTHKSGNGIRMVPMAEVNDPLSTMGDPTGFPRIILYELRPVQILHTPESVLMLYMFEKRWRVIWTEHVEQDRKSTRLNSSHLGISYAVFCL